MDESFDDFMDESNEDFIARVRKMSSATHLAIGAENPRASSGSKVSARGGLTHRRSQRKDVIALVALGRKDSEIADELGIAEDTVRTLRISRM